MVATSSGPQTLTPQNAFPLSGSLENPDTIAEIGKLLLNEPDGFKTWAVDDNERWLCRQYAQRLEHYPDTTRDEWARLKELCLLQHGSPIAAAIDTISSGHRTPAIAEAAIRATGDRFYEAAARHGEDAKEKAQQLFRRIMAGVIPAPSDEELES